MNRSRICVAISRCRKILARAGCGHLINFALLIPSDLGEMGSPMLSTGENMFENRSKAAFAGHLIALLYGFYIVSYFASINDGSGSDAEDIGAGLATVLVLPHMLTLWVGILFGILGFYMRKVGFLLSAGILYSVAAVVFFIYAIFLIPSIVLAFVGYSAQKKINTALPA